MEWIGSDHELYDVLRRPALPQYCDVRPQAIARCSSVEDVIEALASARTAGLQVAPRGGGHCFARRSSTIGLMIDRSVLSTISEVSGSATIGAGARLASVYHGLHEPGLTIPAG